MPKKALKIDRFEKGLLTRFDKRDLPEGGLSNATDVMVDTIGTVRLMGNLRDHPLDMVDASLTPGYGLFSFFTDFNVNGEPYEQAMLAVQQSNYISIVDSEQHTEQIFLGELDNYLGEEGLSDSDNIRPIFYYIDGALRVSDGNINNSLNRSKWYGYLIV